MTTHDVIEPPAQGPNSNTSTTPKKRRRRAAATGASEDCFACRKRQTKCDRRRPYCGQCLAIGKDCSGYKTTLTWGVGVASRGKLRGLSCPVAKQTVEGETETKKTPQPTQRRKSSARKPSTTQESFVESPYTGEFSSVIPVVPSPPRATTRGVKPEADHELHQQSSVPMPVQQSGWNYLTSQPVFPSSHSNQHNPSLDSDSSLSLLHTSLNHARGNDVFPLSANSMSTFSDTEWGNNSEYAPSPAHLHFVDPFPQYLTNSFPPSDGQNLASDPASRGHYYEGAENTHDLAFMQPHISHPDIDDASQYTGEYEPINDTGLYGENVEPRQLADGAMDFVTRLPRSLYISRFLHLSSRMQYLMDYYDKHICSVLVAFDSPVNPYRHHVLDLATQNEGLQNAIAALAINNIRMRSHERTRPIGFVEDSSDQELPESQPTMEEICYKTVSINQLQMQLADPRNAKDDSILATLLILCLFHVCDSGFSKFKTQLEGVQRLLSMRDPGVRTGFIGWVEMFFTWFDVMTSTVNDRETEINGDRLDMMQYSSNLGALEEFSGCDGRLFKLIARLGRLNLLSQNRPVKSQRFREHTPRPQPPPRSYMPFGLGNFWQKRKVTDPMDFTKLDGNGWGTSIVSSDGEVETGLRKESDSRHEFWSEWDDIRARLRSWSMTESLNGGDMTTALMGPEQREMLHINEMFRSSALLYTERLAHPHLPSSSPNFQAFVRDVLTHISSIPVNSCVNKFLLWPLFIAGTECVESSDRAIVRDRCIEIKRESGFYNNISVLDVLERVWVEQGEGSSSDEAEEVKRRKRDTAAEKQGTFGQAFRWRKAMDRADGEYIIV